MVQFQQDSWLPFAALILSSLSVVLASPLHQDTSLMDLQRREVLDRAVGPVPGIIPQQAADDKVTPEGDGSHLYRSAKEDPNDPPIDDPTDYPPEQSERATEYDHDPKDEGPPEEADSKKTTTTVKKGFTKLRDITNRIFANGKWKCEFIPAAPALLLTLQV